jgi:predicted Zn-dependent protease
VAAGCAAAVVLLGAAGCARNAATGERQLMLVDERAEIEMGRQADRVVVARLGLLPNGALQKYVSAVGARVAARSERPGLAWRFRVLDEPSVNAFALPGGFVYVTRGLLAHLNSEAELAVVLGHEIAHVAARHSAVRASQARVASLGLGLIGLASPGIAGGGELAAAGLEATLLELGREHEREADVVALRYATRCGYAPRAMRAVLRLLAQVEDAAAPASAARVLSTHPGARDRLVAIEPRLDRGGSLLGAAYLRAIDGLPFGDDPLASAPVRRQAKLGLGRPAGVVPVAPRRERLRLQVVYSGPLRLAEFDRAFPSVVPLRTIAAINGIPFEDPLAVMPTPAKRVVHPGPR